jgi:hypothetical protein
VANANSHRDFGGAGGSEDKKISIQITKACMKYLIVYSLLANTSSSPPFFGNKKDKSSIIQLYTLNQSSNSIPTHPVPWTPNPTAIGTNQLTPPHSHQIKIIMIIKKFIINIVIKSLFQYLQAWRQL